MVSRLPDLSVVVPTYNALSLSYKSVTTLFDELAARPIDYEVILVDDGSAPENRPDKSKFPPNCRLVQLAENRGKGFAVRSGLVAARGRCRVFTDVDIPYGVEAILRCYEIIDGGKSDLVVGDRSIDGSSLGVPVSLKRRLSSAVFRRVVKTITSLPTRDTQCGLKGLSAAAAEAIVPLLRIDGFAFDVEMLRCAMENGITPQPMPVKLVNEDISTVRLLRDSVTMLLDLMSIHRRASRGGYRFKVSGASNGGMLAVAEDPA